MSFMTEDECAVVGAQIDLHSTEGQDFLTHEIIDPNIGVAEYMPQATRGKPLDFRASRSSRGSTIKRANPFLQTGTFDGTASLPWECVAVWSGGKCT